jgi:hypothetical protein
MNYDTVFKLPPNRRSLIEGELQPGEKIVWLDQPLPRIFTIRTVPLILFAIPFMAFAIFWMAGAAGILKGLVHRTDGPLAYFPLFGVPFLLIGLGMLLSPLWVRRISRDTYYVITDRRAIVFQRGFGMNTRSFTPVQLQVLSKRQWPDGSGDIMFNALSAQPPFATAGILMAGFFSIRNVKEVEGLLMELARKPVQPITEG